MNFQNRRPPGQSCRGKGVVTSLWGAARHPQGDSWAVSGEGSDFKRVSQAVWSFIGLC